MGRPIKPKYLGKYDKGGVGGEIVVYANVTALGTNYYSGNTTVTFTAPQIPGGVTATGTAVIAANNTVTGITITNNGSGYISAPTANVWAPNLITSPTVSVTLSTNQQNTIRCYANIAGNGSTTTKYGDIISQKNGHRYRVRTADGISVCSLAASANSALISTTTDGKMNIQAFDSAGGTYWVKKLWDRTVTLVPVTGTQFVANTKVSWNLSSAVANVSVILDNN